MQTQIVFLGLAIGFGTALGSTAPVPAPSQHQPTDVEMVSAMEQHYSVAILAHDALIQGNLELFREQLAELAGAELPPNSPDHWKGFEGQLHVAALRGSEATDLATAANAMGSVALACGACHQSVVDGPVYPVPPLDDQNEPLKARMREHEMSTLMLWNGVTGPSEYAWDLAAGAIAETRIFAHMDPDEPVGEPLLEREAELRALALEGQTAQSLASRSVLYGRMLSTCGGCHQAIGIKVPAH